MTRRIYMDNSATSFPKPAAVAEAMARFAVECGASAGRGAYAEARACGEILAVCRRRIARLINAEGPERIVFTLNCSHGLNIVIRGLLNTAGPVHAIATALDHNSVLRPYNALAAQTGLQPEFLPCDGRTGLVDRNDPVAGGVGGQPRAQRQQTDDRHGRHARQPPARGGGRRGVPGLM